jgi:hypothetical protein
MSAPHIAALFWFYKEPEISANHLELLRRHNDGLSVYGLYGGPPEEAAAYEARLGPLLDDFYVAPPADAEWKWLNADLVLLEWYRCRGRALAWRQLAVVQWDMLVLDSISNQLPGLKPDEMFLIGLGDLDAAVEKGWFWTVHEDHRPNYLAFREHVRTRYGYRRLPLFSGLFFQVVPRAFFEGYAGMDGLDVGMLEYRVPTYAEILGIPFYRRDLGFRDAMNSDGAEIGDDKVRRELERADGWRLFHPYYKTRSL